MTNTTAATFIPEKTYQHYEDLKGAEGRRINYRAERYKARDIFRAGLPKVELGGAEYMLENISISGLAFAVPKNHDFVLDQERTVPFKLTYQDKVLFENTATVARREKNSFGERVGLQFVDTICDVLRMKQRYQDVLLQRELFTNAFSKLSLVAPEYKELCGDTLFTLRKYKALSEAKQQYIDDGVLTEQDVLAELEPALLHEWRQLWLAGNAQVEGIMNDPDKLVAYKTYTESVLTPEFMGAPIWDRSYHKPLGYPGDFVIMDYLYSMKREGKDLYAKLLHYLGIEMGEFIRTRMEMMRGFIADFISEKSTDAHKKIIAVSTIGCGSAVELRTYLQAAALSHKVELTLLDQDERAMREAYDHAYTQSLRHGGNVSLKCFNTSFMELMQAGKLFKTFPQQDMIYSLGIMDYMAQKRAKQMVEGLYEHLAPGGLLVVGNINNTEGYPLWPLEFIFDWNLVYRSKQDMLDLASDLNAKSVEIYVDKSTYKYFLCIRKH